MADHATSDDAELSGEDLDAFLVLLESRLRADFTSPDLSRIISSQGTVARGGGAPLTTLPSGNPSSPAKFLQLVRQVFGRAGKPIKLRSLLSLLGLDSDGIVEGGAQNKKGGGSSFGAHHVQTQNAGGAKLEGRKTDDVAWKLLREAEESSVELWVRVVAGIVRGKMFEGSKGAEGGAPEASPDAAPEAERQLAKIVAEVLGNTRQAIAAADERLEEATQLLSKEDGANGQKERALDALRIGQDLCPTYAPFWYSLLAPAAVTALVPEVDTNADFAANMDAEILGVDAEVERRRAAEEGKELRTVAAAGVSGGAMARGTAAGRGPGGANPLGGRAPGAILAGRTRGRFSNVGGRGTGRGAASGGTSLFRPSSSVGRGAGRGGLAGRGAAGRAGRAGRSAPLQRRAPGAARALLSASGRGSGGGGGESSKMKMIDASEAEGLARARQEKEAMANLGSVEARKLERKRKLMEDAKASGLRNGREKRSRPAAALGAAAGAADGKSAGPGASDAATNKVDAPTVPQHESAAAPAAPAVAPTPATEQLDSLLDKSNKLSPDQRQSVAAFFRHRASSDRNKPLALPEGADPSTGVWKVKLNEEKTVDPTTGESVKETLYLELNYRVLGFKKTRKVKRK